MSLNSHYIGLIRVSWAFFLLSGARLSCADAWIRAARGVSDKYEPFMMDTVAEESGHLTATASYGEYRDKNESHLPAMIEGVQIQGCTFWPRVTAQVANDIKGEWTVIEQTRINGDTATITLQWKSPNVWLHLDLGAFRPMIGKYKYGRVILTNGQVAIFEMNNLLPPTGPSRAWNWSEDDPLQKLPFAVVGIESMGEDLRAICEYLEMESTSATPIGGTQTPDGDFWPSVIAQVASDCEGAWKTIGEPPSIGKAIMLSIKPKDINVRLLVDLELFRPMIGKFRYGRVVLRNGKAAAFELKNLLPPEEESTLKRRAKP